MLEPFEAVAMHNFAETNSNAPTYTSSMRERVILLANQLVTANNEPARVIDRDATLRTLVQMLRRLSAGNEKTSHEDKAPQIAPMPIHLSLRSANAEDQDHAEEQQCQHVGAYSGTAAATEAAVLFDYGLRPLRPPQPFTVHDLCVSDYVSHNSDCKSPFNTRGNLCNGSGFVHLEERKKRPASCDVLHPLLEVKKANRAFDGPNGGRNDCNPSVTALSTRAIVSNTCGDLWPEDFIVDNGTCSANGKDAAAEEETSDPEEPEDALKDAPGDWWSALEATLGANFKE